MDKAAEMLKALGWNVEPRQPSALRLPPEVTARFPQLPTDYIQFLEHVRCCVNAAETAWFLTEEDFQGTSASAFLWNEFEAMSLEAAGDDSGLTISVTQFWDRHLPVVLSVKPGYAFLALSLMAEDYGKVVMGREPEFEDAEVVCDSFQELLGRLLKTAGTSEGTLLADFI